MAQYVVASKKFGQWDASLGLGWGRLADRGIATNPLTYLDDRFESRRSSVGIDDTGEFAVGDFFSGPEVGVFGGVSYAFESLPITAMLEYNPDKYTRDVSRGAPASVHGLWCYMAQITSILRFQSNTVMRLGYVGSLVRHKSRACQASGSSHYL